VAYVFKAHDSNGARCKSYVAAKCAEAQHGLSLIEVCNKVYDPKYSHWSSAFGGSKWQVVANTLFQLWMATDLSEIMRLIDTAFALQHNTAIVFNKNRLWKGPNSYLWIMETLDAKWTAISPESLLGYASKPLKEVVRANGFSRSFEVAPKKLAVEPHVGMQVTLRDGSSFVEARVKNIVGGYFKSITVESPSFAIHKQAGKYSKTVNFKIYSLAEFLHRLGAAPPMHVGVDMAKGPDKSVTVAPVPANKPKAQQAKTAIHFMQYKAALSSAYEALFDYVQGKGFALGSFLVDGSKVRFRLKGHTSPLRFYFACIGGELKASVGHTDNVGAAQHGVTFSKPDSDSILSFLKGKVDAHIGG
jgi:hypothetical protein